MDRYGLDSDGLRVSPDWQLSRLVGPSPLFGANGMQFGPDGRLFVAQAFGSQVSAIDVDTGACEAVVPVGGPIVGPDDVSFDSKGTLYVTEVMSARVSARFPDGSTKVIAADVPAANGITVHQDRIFMDEFRPGGRLFELFADGRTPRLIAADLPMPNALCVGPDQWLYFPAVAAGEIWRVPIGGGAAERFVDGLDHPTAVKFDRQGRMLTVQAGSGDVTRIDLPSRAKTHVIRVRPGIDNLALSVDGRLFLSHFVDGGVAEIAAGGVERTVVGPGFIGPMGIAVGSAGEIYVADGLSIAVISTDGTCSRAGHLLQPGFPGFVRGVAVAQDGVLRLTNSAGDVVVYRPGQPAQTLASGLGELYDLAVLPDGGLLAVDAAEGRLLRLTPKGEVSTLARGLSRPKGVAVASDGSVYVSESGKGRVVFVDGGVRPVLEGLGEPHGIAISQQVLYVVDRARKTLTALTLDQRRTTETVATGLSVGGAPGVVVKPLPGLPGIIPGPIGAFAGLAASSNGSLYVAADGEGSVLQLVRLSKSARRHDGK